MTNRELVQKYITLQEGNKVLLMRICDETSFGNLKPWQLRKVAKESTLVSTYLNNLDMMRALKIEAELRYGNDLRYVEQLLNLPEKYIG